MSLNPFKQSKNQIIGVDIGTSSVKVVELEKEDEKIQLTNYGEYSGDVNNTIHSNSLKLLSSQAAKIVKQIIKEAKIEAKDATMSIPVFSGFSTIISLPPMPEAELSQAVEYEAKKYIPLPISEVQFEWMRLRGTDAEQNAERTQNSASVQRGGSESVPRNPTKILVVAVTNELINRYNEIAKLSGLTLKYLELETFSLARSLAPKESSASLIIDIGSRSTILCVADNGWPIFTRSMDVSGLALSKVLSSSLGIDFQRAEEFKRNEGVHAGRGVLVPLIDNILQEAKRVIKMYTDKRGRPVGRVVLSGGSGRMPGLLEYVVKSVGRETVMAHPFNGIMYPKELDATLRQIGPSFSVAVGAALRDFK